VKSITLAAAAAAFLAAAAPAHAGVHTVFYDLMVQEHNVLGLSGNSIVSTPDAAWVPQQYSGSFRFAYDPLSSVVTNPFNGPDFTIHTAQNFDQALGINSANPLPAILSGLNTLVQPTTSASSNLAFLNSFVDFWDPAATDAGSREIGYSESLNAASNNQAFSLTQIFRATVAAPDIGSPGDFDLSETALLATLQNLTGTWSLDGSRATGPGNDLSEFVGADFIGTFHVTAVETDALAVPEPAAALLFGTGLIAYARLRRTAASRA